MVEIKWSQEGSEEKIESILFRFIDFPPMGHKFGTRS